MKQFFRHKRFLVTLPVLLLLIGGGVFWYARVAQGVNRTFDGGGQTVPVRERDVLYFSLIS